MRILFKQLLFIFFCVTSLVVYGAAYSADSDAAVKQWASEAFAATFSNNFVKYNEELMQASHYFTREAWNEFKAAMDKSNYLELIKNRTIIATGQADINNMAILKKGPINGMPALILKFPATVTLLMPTDKIVQHYMVKMTIVKTDQGKGGMAIEKMDLEFVMPKGSAAVPPGVAGRPLTNEYKQALEKIIKQ